MGAGGSTRNSKSAVVADEMAARKKGAAGQTPVDKLSDAQLEEFREAFNMFDKDGGGSIDASELKELLASVGQMPTDAELAEMIQAVDADGTGDIDFLEFATLMAHKMHAEGDQATVIAEAFAVFDASGDGLISSGEMRRIMVNLGEALGCTPWHHSHTAPSRHVRLLRGSGSGRARKAERRP